MKKSEKHIEFEYLVLPLMRWLRENHNPHMTVVVDSNGAFFYLFIIIISITSYNKEASAFDSTTKPFFMESVKSIHISIDTAFQFAGLYSTAPPQSESESTYKNCCKSGNKSIVGINDFQITNNAINRDYPILILVALVSLLCFVIGLTLTFFI